MKTPHHAEVMTTLIGRYTEPAASKKETPWEVLLFTLLSARTRDAQTEPAFRAILREYPTIPSLAKAEKGRVEAILKTIGLYRNKARQVVALANALLERHGSKVPTNMTALVALPGVGRKTASCVMVYAYGKPAIAVDTHVHRIVNRLGWVKEKTPENTESALRKTLPEKYWLDINRVMVQFGRDICRPGVPRCWECPVAKWCVYPKKSPAPVDAASRPS